MDWYNVSKNHRLVNRNVERMRGEISRDGVQHAEDSMGKRTIAITIYVDKSLGYKIYLGPLTIELEPLIYNPRLSKDT